MLLSRSEVMFYTTIIAKLKVLQQGLSEIEAEVMAYLQTMSQERLAQVDEAVLKEVSNDGKDTEH